LKIKIFNLIINGESKSNASPAKRFSVIGWYDEFVCPFSLDKEWSY
jgi:hypothetical protein